ncbi:alpha-amylase family glycosyl hydrolase [Luteolibacter algae]|uniref:1,4-alpha-glucan branching enzyme n=1 Tax=Luteolibacter algae TaxID=454151 RepID=A0ABW5D8J9_9BACT
MQTAAIDPTQYPLGSNILEEGTVFRVWAPNADKVSVIGDFNKWDASVHTLEGSEEGVWSIFVAEAKEGDEYKYLITNGENEMERIDPRAIEVTNSTGNAIIRSQEFDWHETEFQMPPHNQLVIYELHAKTFPEESGKSCLDAIIDKLPYLAGLGINAIEVMPLAEFPGDNSWGYNPSHPYAVESSYGGPLALKRLVQAAHKNGIGVILDVVYNHFGPGDLDLWKFDGWSENDGGGIYFYNDWKAETPWGATRPDYGRDEVRSYIFDNAMMWLKDYRVDGLRYDATLLIRNVNEDEDPSNEIPEGWSLVQWINGEIRKQFPERIIIAEDLKSNAALTKSALAGGADFHAQWDANFVFPIRDQLTKAEDDWRSLEDVRKTLLFHYNDDVFQRIIYTESHDEVAQEKARVPQEVQDDNATGYFAQKLSCLGAGLLFTCPGVPMIFQGQEFLQGGSFSDEFPLEWTRAEQFSGLIQMYHDLIHLRQNRDMKTGGLCGQGVIVHHINEEQNVIAFQRFSTHGVGDDVIVVCNLSHEERDGYRIGMPSGGEWKLRFNSDAKLYSELFNDVPSHDIQADGEGQDGMPHSALIRIGPYSTLIYSQGE